MTRKELQDYKWLKDAIVEAIENLGHMTRDALVIGFPAHEHLLGRAISCLIEDGKLELLEDSRLKIADSDSTPTSLVLQSRVRKYLQINGATTRSILEREFHTDGALRSALLLLLEKAFRCQK